MPANIASDLDNLRRPIADLVPLEGNPRRGDIEAVMKSYETFGQRKPIVAKKDGTVIAGNHQLEAAKRLGWEEIAVVTVDDDEQTAKAFALADNRIAELGFTDNDALREYLSALNLSDPALIEATAYTEDEINRLLNSISTSHFEGFLDDLSEGVDRAGFDGDMVVPAQFAGLVPFQVMMTPDQRKDLMAVLKSDVESGSADSPAEALLFRAMP